MTKTENHYYHVSLVKIQNIIKEKYFTLKSWLCMFFFLEGVEITSDLFLFLKQLKHAIFIKMEL